MISSLGRVLSGGTVASRAGNLVHRGTAGMLVAHRTPILHDRRCSGTHKPQAARPLSMFILASASAAEEISIETAHNLVSSGDFTYVDVRTAEEYKAGHAAGAVNFPVMVKSGIIMASNPSFAQNVAKAFPDKEARLVIGCKCGIRSKKACEILAAENYTNLKDFKPGYDGWVEKGLPVE